MEEEEVKTANESPVTQPTPAKLISPKTAPAMASKYDWFKDDISGMNNNLADMYHSGIKPEDFDMHDADKYWKDETIAAPFKQTFGAKAREEFDKVYLASKERFSAFAQDKYDIESTSTPVFNFNSAAAQRLQSAGKATVSKGTPRSYNFGNADPWGRRILSYSPNTGEVTLGTEQHGWREPGNIKVKDASGQFLTVDEYRKRNPGAVFVHAAGEDGAPLVGPDGVNYLRPLAWGEEKKAFEEYYSGDSWNIFGSTGIGTPDWYAAKWLPKNVLNFAADTIDSLAETFKLLDNFWQTGVQSDYDMAMTQFQNVVNSKLWAPTSEYGRTSFLTPEGFFDGMAQIGGQLLGMMGTAKGIMGLSRIAKLGAGTRAGSVGSLLWMSSLASDDFVKEARSIGLTPKEQATAWGIYMMGMYKIQGLSELIVNPLLSKTVVKEALKKYVPHIKAVKDANNGKLSVPGLWQAAKGSLGWADETLRSLLASPSSAAKVLGSTITEAIEEDTEVFWDKGFKEAYNYMYGPYIGSPTYDQLINKKQDARFNVRWEDLPTELAAATTLGGAGGGLFKVSQLMFDKNTPEDRRELLALGAIPGGFEKAEQYIQDNYSRDKLLPGQKKVDIFGNATTDETKSRAYLVREALLQEVKMAKELWTSYNLNLAKREMADKISYLNNETVARYTSFTKDVSSKLEELDSLNAAKLNNNVPLTPEQIKRSEILVQEIQDMASGKYANHYLHEALFNVSPFIVRDSVDASHHLKFQEFLKLNNFMRARNANALKYQSMTPKELLKEALERTTTGLTKKQIDDATDELNKEYGVTINPETGEETTPDGERGLEYAKKLELLQSMELSADWLTGKETRLRSLDPLDDLYATFDSTTGASSVSFEKALSEMEKLAAESIETGSIVFDDVEQTDALLAQIVKRTHQAQAMEAVNRETNSILKKSGYPADQPEITGEQQMAIVERLKLYRARAEGLRKLAQENSTNFGKAVNEAAVKQRMTTSSMLGKVVAEFINSPDYKDDFASLNQLASELIADENPETNEARLVALQTEIHERFATRKQEGILHLRAMLEAGKIDFDTFTYMKAIINVDPRKFASAYQDTLKERITDMRTLLPAQKRNVYRLVSFLMSGYHARETFGKDETDENKLIFRAHFTESILLRGYQGEGKTIIAGTAVRIAQMLSQGKAVVFAKQNEVATKNKDEFKDLLHVEMKEGLQPDGSFESIVKFINNPDSMRDVKYIVIDEATQYRLDEMHALDKLIAEKNLAYKQENLKIKLLLMGDPAQYGPIHPDPSKSQLQYHVGAAIGARSLIEATEMTGFNWRSGNLDIQSALQNLRAMALKSSNTSFPDIVVNYDSKEKAGVLVIDDFKKILSGRASSTDYVVISTPEKLAEYAALGVPSSRLLTVPQVQGRAWRTVYIDLPFDLDRPGEARAQEISMMLTAVGRAVDEVIIKDVPYISIKSIEGKSASKSSHLSDKNKQDMRAAEIKAYEKIGLQPIERLSTDINRVDEPVNLENVVSTQAQKVSSDFQSTINEVVASTIGKSKTDLKHTWIGLHTYFNNGTRFRDDGTGVQLSEFEIENAKKQLLTGTVLPFESDQVVFEIRWGQDQWLSETYNTEFQRQDAKLKFADKQILFARFKQNGVDVAEVSIGEFSIKDFKLPAAIAGKAFALPYGTQRSQEILATLRAEYLTAANGNSTVNAFKQLALERRQGIKRVDKGIRLDEFLRRFPRVNPSEHVWHVTVPGQEKEAHIFLSYSKTSEEIEKILRTKQASQFGPGYINSTDIKIDDEQRRALEAMGIISIPIEGGQVVPFYTFLEQLRSQRINKTPYEKWQYKISDHQATRIKDGLAYWLSPRATAFDDATKKELEDKVYSGENAAVLNYLKNVVAYNIREDKKETEKRAQRAQEEASDKVKESKVARITKQVKRLYVTDLMIALYEAKVNGDKTADPNGKNLPKSELASKALDMIQNATRGEKGGALFPHGWRLSAPVIEGYTKPADAPFAATSNEFKEYAVTGITAPPAPVVQFPIDIVLEAGTSEAPREVQVTKELRRAAPKPAKIEVTAETDENNIPVDEYIAKTKDKNIDGAQGVMSRWFSDETNFVFFPEFVRYFKSQVYNAIFELKGENPRITEEQALSAVIAKLKSDKQTIVDSFGKDKFGVVVALLKQGNPQREIYYDHVMTRELDTMLRQYFPSILKNEDGQYTFAQTRFRYNQMKDSGSQVSHLESGSKMVALHIHNTPRLEITEYRDRKTNELKRKYSTRRNLSREDYVMLIRDMKDNNINSVDKAIKYFGGDGSIAADNLSQVKYSIYQRFLSPTPIEIDGIKYHSMSQLGKTPEQLRIATETTTALLSFLSSGNSVEYIKVFMMFDGETETTGRFMGYSMTADYFRDDLEAGVKGRLRRYFYDKRTAPAGTSVNSPAIYEKTSKGETVVFTVRTDKGPRTITAKFTKNAANPYTITQGANRDPLEKESVGYLLQEVGLGTYNKYNFSEIRANKNFIPVMIAIGKYLHEKKQDARVFAGKDLFQWEPFAATLKNIADIQPTYGYRLLGKDKVNLVSLAAPYARTNQKVKEYQQSLIEGPMKALALIKGSLGVQNFYIKEGFQLKNGDRVKPVSDLTVKELFEYDFRDSYLEALAKQSGRNRANVSVPFTPSTFADKSFNLSVLFNGEWLPTTGGKIDMRILKDRFIKEKNQYYIQVGNIVLRTWNDAMKQIGRSLPITSAPTPEGLIIALREINKIIPTLTSIEVKALMASPLVKGLMYEVATDKTTGELRMLPMNESLMRSIDITELAKDEEAAYQLYVLQYNSLNINKRSLQSKLGLIGITEEEARDTYFWNWNWASFNFNSLHFGPLEQYNSNSDRVKRATATSTHRYRPIIRSENWKPGDNLYEGMKMGKSSKTAIVTDFVVSPDMISYMGRTSLKVYDGLAFHNIYSALMMKASYGGVFGFNVGANLKPISAFMKEALGTSRFDKYASFEITQQMSRDHGDPFIRKIDDLMKRSVKFRTPVTVEGGVANNLAELEALMLPKGFTEEDVLKVMIENGVQDDFITEVIFDSSVKTGASDINSFANPQELTMSLQPLRFIERGNDERGLILDANKDSEGNESLFATQFLGAMLQHPVTEQYATNILAAIEKIGDLERKKMPNPTSSTMLDPLRDRMALQDNPGYVHHILSTGLTPVNNIQILKTAFSSYASMLSKKTVKIDILGGQQVMAPITGVFKKSKVTKFIATAQEIEQGMADEPNGFIARRVNAAGQTEEIKQTKAWKNLVEAYNSKNIELTERRREELGQELSTGGWEVVPPDVVISPTSLSKFNIREGSQPQDVTPKALALWNMRAKFKVDQITDEAEKLVYQELGKQMRSLRAAGDFAGQEALRAQRTAIKDKYIAPAMEAELPKYEKMHLAFLNTLKVLGGRIPGTTIHSVLPMNVIGFAWGADNRFHAHPDVLILQGSDQDIDKGNFLMFEPDGSGEVDIPATLEEARTLLQLKNYIVSQMWKGTTQPGALMISTMPTTTTAIDQKLKEYDAETNPYSHPSNPITNNEKYAEGQMARDAVATTATGLKVYNGMVFSARKRGKKYEVYLPKSAALQRGGQKMRIGESLQTLQYYDEFIQAALDNAKEPRLARAAMNSDNAQIVNALGFFGYTPAQAIEFLRSKPIRDIFIRYAELKEFGINEEFVDFQSLLSETMQKAPETAELEDLAYLYGFGKMMFEVGNIFSVNKETPNSLYKAYLFNRSFKLLTKGEELGEYIKALEPGQEALLKEMHERVAFRNTNPDAIHILEILEDNPHMLSYIKSFSHQHNTWLENVKMYRYINDITDRVGRKISEQKHEEIVRFVYGLGVDAFLESKKAIVRVKGVIYDLTSVVDTEDMKGRISFMRDFPFYVSNLRSKEPGSILEHLRAQLDDTSSEMMLKPEGNLREYSPEKLAVVKMAMKNAGKMVITPDGDSDLTQLLFLYSLIKDKGGMSGTSYTDMFIYPGSGFAEFDQFVASSRFESNYFASERGKEDAVLNMKFASRYMWEFSDRENDLVRNKDVKEKREIMKRNWMAIPYSSSPTLNALITAEDMTGAKSSRSKMDIDDVPLLTSKGWVGSKSGKRMNPYATDPRQLYNIESDEDKAKREKAQEEEDIRKFEEKKRWEAEQEEDSSSLPPATEGTSDESSGNDADTPPAEESPDEDIYPSEEFAPNEREMIRKAQRNKIDHSMITKFAAMMGKKFGVQVDVMTTSQITENFGVRWARAKGLFIQGDSRVVINSDKVTIDTPIHEFSHIFILGLRRENPALYQKIIAESLQHPYAKDIRAKYPDQSEEFVAMEVFATLSGHYNAGRVLDFFNRDWFDRLKDVFREFLAWVNKKLKEFNFSPIFGTAVSVNDSLIDVIDKVGESVISALKLNSSEMSTLDLLGVKLVPADSRLSAIRNRLRASKRIEKICD